MLTEHRTVLTKRLLPLGAHIGAIAKRHEWYFCLLTRSMMLCLLSTTLMVRKVMHFGALMTQERWLLTSGSMFKPCYQVFDKAPAHWR